MNRHKELSIQFLQNNAADVYTITVPNQSKAPTTKTDFSGSDALVKSNVALKKLQEPSNSFQPGAVFKGRWVDVDLDEQNLILEDALATFLNTPFVFGRKSKPRSHFLVQLDEPFERHDGRFKFMASVRSMGLDMELRGHKDNASLHTNLPGGQHETGESITWHDPDLVKEALSVTPPITYTRDFARGLRKAIISAKLVDYWSEGSRHEMALGVAGMLAKNYKLMIDNEEAPDAIETLLNEADCEAIIRFAAAKSGDEEIEDRIRASKGTWKKQDASAISGYDKLVNVMGEENARLLRVAIAGSQFMDTVEKYNQMVAYSPQMMAYVILSEIPKYGMVFRSFGEYMQHLPSHLIPMPGKKEKYVHAAKVLRMLEVTRNIDETDFLPDEPVLVHRAGRTILNNFRGWRVNQISDTVDETDPDIKFVINHVEKIICSGNQELMHWVFSWWADIYQQPNQKPGTALILVSKQQGTGKSSLSGVLGGALGVALGRRAFDPKAYYLETSDVDKVMGRFNDHMEGMLLVQLEEVINSGTSRALSALATASRLKDLITKNQDLIEAKGLRVRAVPNYSRYLLTSNSLTQSARIEAHDRRYTVVEVSSKKRNDLDYWGNVFDKISGEEFHAKVFKWLQGYKYDKKLIQRPFETKAKVHLRQVTAMRDDTQTEENFLVQLLQREGMPFRDFLIEHHWDACTEKSLEKYNAFYAGVKYTDSWPEFISADLWDRAYKHFIKEDMKIHMTLPSQDVFFLNKFVEVKKTKRTVKWTTNDKLEHRKEQRKTLLAFPTRRQLLNALLKVEPSPINEHEKLEIEKLCEEDEGFSPTENSTNTTEF